MLSFCLGKIYEKNQSRAVRPLFLYKIAPAQPEKEWNSERNTHTDIFYCITDLVRIHCLASEKSEKGPGRK